MIDAVRVALTAVRTREPPPHGDLAVVELGGVSGMLIGVDEFRRPHVLLPVDEQGPKVRSEVASLEVGVRALMVDGRTRSFLDVVCLFQSVADVFEHFVAAIADRFLASPQDATHAVLEVLEKWKQFLPASCPRRAGKARCSLRRVTRPARCGSS